MPMTLTLGGIVMSVLGLLIAFAGLPDRSAGLGLGSDLLQAGASIFAGGLVVAALGQVLRALREMGDRLEDAVYDLAAPKNSLNDELAAETPRPLPRAAAPARSAAVPSAPAIEQEEIETPRPTREPRAARPAPVAHEPLPSQQPQPAARAPRVSPSPARSAPRPELRRPEPMPDPEDRQEDMADDFQPRRSEPRWMRAQSETGDRGTQPTAVIPLSNRPTRATPTPVAPRREPSAPQPAPDLRRRVAPAAPPVQPEPPEPVEVSVVRSGIIAGMAYTLYSDGSIEAELPAGLVRFASLAELQAHVQRAGADEDGEPNAMQR